MLSPAAVEWPAKHGEVYDRAAAERYLGRSADLINTKAIHIATSGAMPQATHKDKLRLCLDIAEMVDIIGGVEYCEWRLTALASSTRMRYSLYMSRAPMPEIPAHILARMQRLNSDLCVRDADGLPSPKLSQRLHFPPRPVAGCKDDLYEFASQVIWFENLIASFDDRNHLSGFYEVQLAARYRDEIRAILQWLVEFGVVVTSARR